MKQHPRRWLLPIALLLLASSSVLYVWTNHTSHTPPPPRSPASTHDQRDRSIAIQRPLFSAIDAHTHIHHKAYGEAVRLMDALGIQAMVNLSGGAPGQGLAKHLRASQQYPGRFAVLMTPDFSLLDEPNGPQKLAKSLAKAVKMGAKGIKIYKSLGLHLTTAEGQRIPVDTPLLSPLWHMAARLRVPVAIHTGDPKAFFQPLNKHNERFEELSLNPHWSFADRKRYPSWETLYNEFLQLVAKHPKTTFIGLHFGNQPEDVVAVGRALARYPNLWIDIAARLPEIGRQKTQNVRDVFLRFQDRILFATDLAIRPSLKPSTQAFRYTLGAPMKPMPTPQEAMHYFWRHWTFLQTAERELRNPTPIQGRWRIHGLTLPPSVLRKLYRNNALSLFPFAKPGQHHRRKP